MSSEQEPEGGQSLPSDGGQTLPLPANIGVGFQPPSYLDPKEERESQTARLLALILVGVLVGVFVIHYALTAVLGIYHPDIVDKLTQVFSIAFPVFSGLVGTAVGFYLKERK